MVVRSTQVDMRLSPFPIQRPTARSAIDVLVGATPDSSPTVCEFAADALKPIARGALPTGKTTHARWSTWWQSNRSRFPEQ